jgi:DNA-binding NarL/FixJ family response regulator
VRVILADDQSIVRSALRLLLTTKTSHTVIAEAATAGDLLAQVSASEPDIILLDWQLRGEQAVRLLALLRDRWPAVVLIVLSSQPDKRVEALQAGAAFFVSKTSSPDEVLAVLNSFSDDSENEL